MAALKITGHKKISGKIKIAGNKNSVLPIMAASLMTNEPCYLENVPEIADVDVMISLLKILGSRVEKNGSKLTIQTIKINDAVLPEGLTQKLRASILVLGPLAAKGKTAKIGYPGGDVIGRRPLNTHLQALKAFGVTIEESNGFINLQADKLKGCEIFLEEASVTATENAIMAATLAQGKTRIKRAASEPHIIDLCEFLIKMGAKIKGHGSNVITIEGVKALKGVRHVIRSDHIEVGTFAIMASVLESELEIAPIVKEDLDMILLTLKKFGVIYKIKGNSLFIEKGKLTATEKVVTDVWPGFPTDLIPPMIVLATQAQGATVIHDWMYESRMFFVDKLLSMGAKVEIADPHRVLVYGSSELRGQKLDTPDIRAGIALVIAALAARGESTIERAELIERGYEKLAERLSKIGVNIKKIG